MALKVFIDANVYLDVIQQRGDDWQFAEDVLLLAEQNRIKAYTSASNLLNIMYVMSAEKLSRPHLIRNAIGILRCSTLVNPDNKLFETALSSSFTDLEDAVQYFTAASIAGIDHFITSNIKDFKQAPPTLPVVSPKAFLKIWDNSLV